MSRELGKVVEVMRDGTVSVTLNINDVVKLIEDGIFAVIDGELRLVSKQRGKKNEL